MADDIPRVISTEDPADDDHEEKRKGRSIDNLISKVKYKTGKKKSNSALLPSPKKKSNKTATEATAADTANKKTKKKKTKTKAKKDKPKKSSKSSDEADDDILGEDEYELVDSSESEGEMSIPFVIEVIADGEDELDLARDEEKESKKHESMHNSHNALRVLERADSGKGLKLMAGKSKRISSEAPQRTRSINAHQALERVNSSKPLSEMQREIKTRERPRGVGRKRPSATANPHRHSSLKDKGNTAGHGRPQRTKSLNAAHAHAAETSEFKDLHGGSEAQRKADRRSHRRNNTSGLDDIVNNSSSNNNGSSRRTQRSIDDDSGGSSRRMNRSTDEDFVGSSRRTQRSIDRSIDIETSTRRTQRSIDRSVDIDTSTRRTQRSIDSTNWDDDDNNRSGEMGLANDDVESKKRAAERRARRESQRNTSSQAAEVLQRADSGKSLKEIANDSRRRRSNSVSSHKGSHHKRGGSTGPRNRRTSVATPEVGSTAVDSKRMQEIEAQIKAEEAALKEGH